MAPSPAVEVRELRVHDFLSPEDLKKKKSLYAMAGQLEPDPKRHPKFVGQDDRGEPWIASTYDDVARRVDAFDAGGSRTPPSAVIGCSRSGKTRALIELGSALRSRRDANVIFVSFSDKTSYVKGESSSPLKSLLARIAYAAAKPDVTNGLLLHVGGKLRFTTTVDAVLDWLGNNDCVLLIDDLDKCIGPGVDGADIVVRFIRWNFVMTKQRYYVFSTRVWSTTRVIMTLGEPPENHTFDRAVHTVALPLVKNHSDWEALTDCEGAHPAWFGLSPGFIYAAKIESDTLSQKWSNAYDSLKLSVQSDAAALYETILLDLLTPFRTDWAVESQVEQFARVSVRVEVTHQTSGSRRSWSPMAVHFVLSRFTQKVTAVAVCGLLDALRTTEIGGGKAWEIAVACALMLRAELALSSTWEYSALRVKKTSGGAGTLDEADENRKPCLRLPRQSRQVPRFEDTFRLVSNST